jgi:excisionase family DNA binding protein
MPNCSNLLTIQEAADFLGISMPTARRWTATGKLPVKRFSSRVLRISGADLAAFVESAPKNREEA